MLGKSKRLAAQRSSQATMDRFSNASEKPRKTNSTRKMEESQPLEHSTSQKEDQQTTQEKREDHPSPSSNKEVGNLSLPTSQFDDSIINPGQGTPIASNNNQTQSQVTQIILDHTDRQMEGLRHNFKIRMPPLTSINPLNQNVNNRAPMPTLLVDTHSHASRIKHICTDHTTLISEMNNLHQQDLQ